jgi:hypothetical protein
MNELKERRGRWHPSQAQISLAIDCAVARMPIGKAAGLLGVGPRTLWLFAKRTGLPDIFGAWRDRPRYVSPPRASGGSRTAETAGPAVPGGAEP